MTPEQLQCYTEEVWLQAKVSMLEYGRLANLLADLEQRQNRLLWVYLQAFLNHSAMVSKLFWPPTKRQVSLDRGRELSQYLEVVETSALNNRTARNAIEHLDERMDNWLLGGQAGFLEAVFQNRAQLNYLRRDRWAIRRVLLVDEMIFVTQGAAEREEVELRPIREGLEQLVTVCEQRFKANDPFRSLP